MSEFVEIQQSKGVGFLLVNNPPVNSLCASVPTHRCRNPFAKFGRSAELLRKLAEEDKTFREYDAEHSR